MIQKYKWMTHHSLPTRLDQSLESHLRQHDSRLSKTKIRKLILAGAVRVDGHITRICSRILTGQKEIHVVFRPESLFPPQALPPEIPTLFEDDALLIVNKPAGLPTQPTVDPLRPNVFGILKNRFKPYLGLHHRLDRDTSGVLLFTKDKTANSSIADQFKLRTIKKTYLALVEGKPILRKPLRTEWTVRTSLKASRQGGIQYMQVVKKGGLDAETVFSLLAKKNTTGLVLAKPLTGRMHQIRAHLSSVGLPIIGDAAYQSTQSSPRILLHAFQLSLEHPKLKAQLTIQAPLPQDFISGLDTLDITLPAQLFS